MSPVVAIILIFCIYSICTSCAFRASKTLIHTTIPDHNCSNTRINKSNTQHYHHRCHISLPSLLSPPSLSSLLSVLLMMSTETFKTKDSTGPKLIEPYDIASGNKLFIKGVKIMKSMLRNANGTNKWMRPKCQQVHQSDQ